MTTTVERGNGARVVSTPGQDYQEIPVGYGIDDQAAEVAAANLPTALGIRLDNDGLRASPVRLARALREMLNPPRFDFVAS